MVFLGKNIPELFLIFNAMIDLTRETPLREKCPNTEFFMVCIILYSDWTQEDTDQKKLRIWTLFTQWRFSSTSFSAKYSRLEWRTIKKLF